MHKIPPRYNVASHEDTMDKNHHISGIKKGTPSIPNVRSRPYFFKDHSKFADKKCILPSNAKVMLQFVCYNWDHTKLAHRVHRYC